MHKDKKHNPNFKVSINQKLLTTSYPIPDTPEAYFPYQPYPEQSHIIHSLHQTIVSSQNSLIESPTGTGKTLCLLVGSLSALKTMNNKQTKIFYLTRTHSQITQVINELKKTIYLAKVNIIASRDHLCVNPNTKEVKGRVLQKVCNDLVSQKNCLFQQSDNRKGYVSKKEILQLEDFRDECRKELVCPFFYSKELIQKTELTILPFNYFLDWKMFQSFSNMIKDAVVIFDEAHNVDSMAEDGANLEIDTKMLGYAIGELKSLEKKFKFESETNTKHKSQITAAYMTIERLKTALQEQRQRTFCSKSELQEFICSSTTIADPSDRTSSLDGLDLGDSMQFFCRLNNVTKLFYKKETQPTSFLNVIACLEKLCMLWRDQHFQKNFITKIMTDDHDKTFVLKLKCLSPAVGFKKLVECHPRSIILSSGTMGDLNKWQKYLNLQFHQKLKIDSFITSKQLLAAIVPKSQSQYTFEFSYQKKDYENQHRELAEELSRIQTAIPDGNGIVVAFSTYLLMEKIVKFCTKLTKKVFYETKGSDVAKTFADYSQAAKDKGAFLFIVMKGRFSEGINFSDYLCRCLVIVGIPFLPRKQPSIQEKINYIKETFSHEQSQEWYKEQTFQAVNQTIGRVIRSKKDYGVILLMDQRYGKKENFQLLSGWFKRCVRESSGQGVCESLTQFFVKEEWVGKEGQEVEGQKIMETKKQLLNVKQTGVKTLKRQKRHLKLKYDSEQKQRSGKKDRLVSDQNDTSSEKSVKGQSNFISHKQKKIKQTFPSSSDLFKTPPRQQKSLTSTASIVLSKINIEKKHKLRGFINKQMLKPPHPQPSSSFLSEKKNQDETIKVETQMAKTSLKRPTNNSKLEQKANENRMDLFLEFFMI